MLMMEQGACYLEYIDTVGWALGMRKIIRIFYWKWLGTRPFLLLAHKRPSPFFCTYPHKKTLFYTDK